MPIPHQIAEVAQDAFNRRDAETLFSLWSEDFRYEGPDGSLHGRAAMLEREHMLWHAFPDLRVSMRTFCDAGDRLVIVTVMEGTHQGPLRLGNRDLPASGRTISLTISANMEIRDGQIRGERVFFDRLQLFEQLGLSESQE